MREYRNELSAMHRLRAKISWLGKGINGSHCRPLKDGIRTATCAEEVYAALDGWLERAAGDLQPDAAVLS